MTALLEYLDLLSPFPRSSCYPNTMRDCSIRVSRSFSYKMPFLGAHFSNFPPIFPALCSLLLPKYFSKQNRRIPKVHSMLSQVDRWEGPQLIHIHWVHYTKPLLQHQQMWPDLPKRVFHTHPNYELWQFITWDWEQLLTWNLIIGEHQHRLIDGDLHRS